MEVVAGASNQSNERRESAGDHEEAPMTDSALCKRAAQVKEKYQDDTYAWAMRTLEVIFEYFQKDEERDKAVRELTKVVENLCLQDVEYNRSKELFDRFCLLHPVKSSPQGYDYASEFKKYLAKERKSKKEDATAHPKYLKFLDRVKELERGKQLSQTDAISVE